MFRFGMPSLAAFEGMEQNAVLCGKLGLSFVEANMNLPFFQPDGLEKAARIAAAHGVGMTLHADENFAPADFNPILAEAHMETLRQTLRLAVRLEVPTVNIHLNRGVYFSLPEGRLYVHEKHRSAWMERMGALRAMCEAELRGSGVLVCVENTDGWLDYQLDALRFLLESDVFALTWDIGHDCAAGGGDKAFLSEHGGKLAHFHIHDGRGKQSHLPLGDGEIPVDMYLKTARERRASCVLETKSPDGLIRSVEWLRAGGWL